MPIQIDLHYTADLSKPVFLQTLPPMMFAGDDQAHRFIVTVMHGAEKQSLTGCLIKGYVLRCDGATCIMDGSVDEQGRAVLALNEASYYSSGRVQIAIRAIQGDVKTVIFAAEGGIMRVSSDSMVDPDNVIPSLDELFAQIDLMEQATAAANAAADKANNAQGPAGVTPNLTIGTVSTLPAGSLATASFTGTAENPVLNLGIPKGVDGDGADGTVQSVNGMAGAVVLTAEDVGALPITGGAAIGSIGVSADSYPQFILSNASGAHLGLLYVETTNGGNGSIVLRTYSNLTGDSFYQYKFSPNGGIFAQSGGTGTKYEVLTTNAPMVIGETVVTGAQISANGYVSNQVANVTAISGYTPLVVVAMQSTSSYLQQYAMYLSGDSIVYSVRNYSSQAVTPTYYFRVLYVRS